MDLIYTNRNRVDQGVLPSHSFDLSYGATENDFSLTLGSGEATIEAASVIYIEGTEYGGIVGGMKTSTESETVTYYGRTWHGIINSKVIEPDTGEDYLVVSGDANEVLAFLVARLGLSDLFVIPGEQSGITINKHKFHRYCKGYDGIRDMLMDNGAKLRTMWHDGAVTLSAKPVVDYTADPLDGDSVYLTVEQQTQKVNHLICLGKGELAGREVIHLYADQYGAIVDTQYYTGLDEITEIYENTNAESLEELRKGGVSRFKELRNADRADISVTETSAIVYDIGDIVGATELKTGISVAAAVTQKIVKIKNGAVSIEYKTGG